MPALYADLLPQFIGTNSHELLGRLTSGLAREGFDTTTATTFSWEQEISELQHALGSIIARLPSASRWHILLEYVLPIVGQRVDCILLADDLIYVIEYKGGNATSANAALRQSQEYALNLVDFHEASRGRAAIPIAVGAFRTQLPFASENSGAAVTHAGLPEVIIRSYEEYTHQSEGIDPAAWNHSRYFPVPTIIEAASEMYRRHNVRNLAYSRAGSDNLETTQAAIVDAVRDARERDAKLLIVVTGVPGAGKTLAGLNAVELITRSLDLNAEQAAFLSGNGPLVAVLQEALKRSMGSRKKGVARSVRSRIREVHRFVRDSYGDTRPPADRLIVFDEAQRAWTAAKNLKKFNRDVSEPEMILEIMGRHAGWTVVIALVGGGQEIHGGEAGLAAWGDAISKHPEWEVVTSPEAIVGGASVAGSRLFRREPELPGEIRQEAALHLRVSKRSFESQVTAAWVNAVLEGRSDEACELAAQEIPIFLSRSLEDVRSWLRAKTKGNRRVGLVASSGAARLRSEGVEPPTFDFCRGIDYVKWFLEPAGDYRSSNQLEVALSEFELQGLELDLTGLLWGGDLIFPGGQVTVRKLSGTKWQTVAGTGDPHMGADDHRTRILNKYRVLLTRFRKAMVIFVPKGSTADSTQSASDFDTTYEYLIRCGAKPLTESLVSKRRAAQQSL